MFFCRKKTHNSPLITHNSPLIAHCSIAYRFYNAEMSSFERPVVWAMVATSTPQALRLRAISTVFWASPSALPSALPFASPFFSTIWMQRRFFTPTPLLTVLPMTAGTLLLTTKTIRPLLKLFLLML